MFATWTPRKHHLKGGERDDEKLTFGGYEVGPEPIVINGETKITPISRVKQPPFYWTRHFGGYMTPFKKTIVGAHLGQSTRGHHLPFNCWGENSTHQIESTSCCWNSLGQWKTRPLGQEEDFEWYQKLIAILGHWYEGTRATAKTYPHQDSFPQLIHLERQTTLRFNIWFTCTISKIYVQTPSIHTNISTAKTLQFHVSLYFFSPQSDPAAKPPHIPPLRK